MNSNTRIGVISLIIVIIIIAIIALRMQTPAAPAGNPPGSTGQLINTVSYACNAGKTITAAYYEGNTTPATTADQPPTPGGSVQLTLSDGRTMTLPQTISADGTRYASADGSVVFWSKGNGLTFTENGTETYMGCVQQAADTGGLPQVYQSATKGFSIRYPANFTVDESYKYQALGPGKDIPGVKFTIDPALATGTNLSPDSYLSVEQLSQASSCSAELFLSPGAKSMTMTDNGVTYSMATSSDAGAGNRYEETVYAIPGTSPCIAVRYFIHYGAIENYPAGSVKAFDEAALTGQFDAMRRTLVIAH